MDEDALWDDRWGEYMEAQRLEEEYGSNTEYAAAFDAHIANQIEEIFDANQRKIFRRKVEAWSREHWVPAQKAALRVGREARELQNAGYHAQAVVCSATCAELILRELTLKPIFVGLFLGETRADEALKLMLHNRALRPETLKIAVAALKTVVGFDVDEIASWRKIPIFVSQRHNIVHAGAEATAADAQTAVDAVAELYATLLPAMRDICGIPRLRGEPSGFDQ